MATGVVVGFQQIAGGAPSAVTGMTEHLWNETQRQQDAVLAQYYAKGTEIGQETERLTELGHQVAAGTLPFSEAKGELVRDYLRQDGDPDLLDAYSERVGHRLAAIIERIQDGVELAPIAILRPDIHPDVVLGLGIDPDVLLSKGEINALLAGRRADGEKISGKHYAVTRQSVNARTGERSISQPIGSYDFCPSPDKSVSVAHAFASPAEKALLLDAHLNAARAAVGYIAEHVGQARMGKGGADGFEPGHVAWLEFTHYTTRRVVMEIERDTATKKIVAANTAAGDPALHTHFLIPNAVFTARGRVGSLDTAAVPGLVDEAGGLYHAQLAQNLRSAGFAVDLDPATGAARIPTIPDHIRTLFSKRSQIGETLARQEAVAQGRNWDSMSDGERSDRITDQVRRLDQREQGAKDDKPDLDAWTREAAAAGWTPPRSFQVFGPEPPPLTQEQRHDLAYETALPFVARQLDHQAVITHHIPRAAAFRGLIHAGMEAVSDSDAVTKLMRTHGVDQYGERTALVWGQETGKRHLSVTTALHVGQETEFKQLAAAAVADRSGAIRRGDIDRHVAASGLDFRDTHGQAQRRAIDRIALGGKLHVVIGAAGSGKSSLLQVLTPAWREQQREVWGISLAWRQADDLVNGGIDPSRLKAFSVMMNGITDGTIRMAPQSVVVVDELALLGTRQGLELMRAQARHGFTVLALGDDRQCQAPTAGAIVDLLRDALGAEQVPEILSTKRQVTEREREIAGLLRKGQSGEAVAMKREDGSLEIVPGPAAAVIARTAKLYVERLQTGATITVSAPTNQDAQQIAAAIRQARRKLGQIGPDLITRAATDGERQYPLPLAKGDRVRLFKSTGARFSNGRSGNIGRNGSVLEVVDLDDRGITLQGKSGKIGHVPWGRLTDPDSGRLLLAYGDVLTVHSAQGSTATEHILSLPRGSASIDGHTGYAALTRHRERSYMLTSETAEREDVRQRRPLNDARPVDQDDLHANVSRHLAQIGNRSLATRLLDSAQSIRQGAANAFPAAMVGAEHRDRQGQRPSHVPELAERHRLSELPIIARIAEYGREAQRRIAQQISRAQHSVDWER